MKNFIAAFIFVCMSFTSCKGQLGLENFINDSTFYDATIFWKFQSDELTKMSEAKLLRIAQYLQQNQTVTLTIKMYEWQEPDLSIDYINLRVSSLVRFFVSRGVVKERIQAQGFHIFEEPRDRPYFLLFAFSKQ